MSAAPSRLAPMDVGGRAARLRGRFEAEDIDALLVTRLPNVRYLTGFTGSAAILLVGPDELVFVTDGRYAEQAADQVGAAGVPAQIEVRASQAGQRDVMRDAAAGYPRLGLEAHGVTWAQQRAFAREWFAGADLVPTEHLVEDLRRVKEPAEAARIQAACAIADDALGVVAPRLADGPSERDVALWLELEMRDRGATGTSFDTIVASGPNGAKPHARPSGRPIAGGEPVVIDFGCVVDGYCSDMTRTLSVGDPGPEVRRMFDVVRAAQQSGRDAVRARAECAQVDKACRDVIDAAGWGDAFVHGTGHGVGLEIHEAPRVAATARDTLASGYVVTVEPGVYLPGTGGVRIEDTVVVTDDGAEVLTRFPKEFLL
ncbi:MAG TPA: Xaa-Pro peptidase family protein [Acidimicrobiia bacterium]|nr:Xaa-Pro peptidase family protein [Acidimicrobiia bacterium]